METREIEARLQRTLVYCPECEEGVLSVAAEGVPAQTLRHGDCGHDFFMDLDADSPAIAQAEGE